jgi:hypothetical protein
MRVACCADLSDAIASCKQENVMPDSLLTELEVAKHLHVSVACVRRWRSGAPRAKVPKDWSTCPIQPSGCGSLDQSRPAGGGNELVADEAALLASQANRNPQHRPKGNRMAVYKQRESKNWWYMITLLTISCAPISSGLLTAQINNAERVSSCKASQLSATEDRRDSVGIDRGVGHLAMTVISHHAMTIAVQNRSSSPCILQGVPTLAFLDATNHAFSASVCSNCDDYLFRSQPVRKIILEPNASAYVVLGYDIDDSEYALIPCRYAAALRMYLSEQRESLKFEVSQGHDKIGSCGPVVVTSFLEKPPADGFLPDPAIPQK